MFSTSGEREENIGRWSIDCGQTEKQLFLIDSRRTDGDGSGNRCCILRFSAVDIFPQYKIFQFLKKYIIQCSPLSMSISQLWWPLRSTPKAHFIEKVPPDIRDTVTVTTYGWPRSGHYKRSPLYSVFKANLLSYVRYVHNNNDRSASSSSSSSSSIMNEDCLFVLLKSELESELKTKVPIWPLPAKPSLSPPIEWKVWKL